MNLKNPKLIINKQTSLIQKRTYPHGLIVCITSIKIENIFVLVTYSYSYSISLSETITTFEDYIRIIFFIVEEYGQPAENILGFFIKLLRIVNDPEQSKYINTFISKQKQYEKSLMAKLSRIGPDPNTYLFKKLTLKGKKIIQNHVMRCHSLTFILVFFRCQIQSHSFWRN